MPLYEYRCKKCDTRFEKFVRSLSAQNVVRCPRCGSGEVEKAISLFGVGTRSRSAGASSCTPGSV